MRHISAALFAGACVAAVAQPAYAQQQEFAVPAGSLKDALDAFSRQSGRQILYRVDDIRGIRSPGVHGRMMAEAALQSLLRGTGFAHRADSSGAIAIIRQRSALHGPGGTWAGEGGGLADAEGEVITVTGSRIRVNDTPSPVITIDAEQVREEGFSDLGEVIRSLPQNFSGGQNPGVALGASLGGPANQNLTSGSALNLRGLGPDATVTLLNGRRLSYSGFVNAVDISVIPIAALDRIEIITDGASAIYGSDAVAGVGNIITRRDFDGVRADYQIAGATQGGGMESRYGLAAGKTWRAGGVIAAYEYSDIDAIYAHQRDYLDYMPGIASLIPERSQHNLFASAQTTFGAATFTVDGIYSARNSLTTTTQPPMYYTHESDAENYVIAPSAEFSLASDWTLSLGGSYARDENTYEALYYSLSGALTNRSSGCYCNSTTTLEFGAEGPLFALPAGEVRIAMGGGHRASAFDHRLDTPGTPISGERSSEYAYGEVLLPLLSPTVGGLGHRLDLTAAVRYEDYDDLGEVVTPKVGLVYQPSADFTIKTSWGESYKAPNLIQQYQENTVFLQPAANLGATDYPPDATALMISGGNPDLKPETAKTWTASVLVHPDSLPGLQFEVGVFDVDYTDRVILPVSNRTAAFRDPVYAPFVVLDPSAALQSEVIARGAGGLVNATPAPYDPTKVMGILYAHYANVAQQRVRGVDIAARYGFGLGGGRMSLRGSASLLEIKQRSNPADAQFETTGLVFNPPNFRARAVVSWQDERFSLGATVAHLDGVTNNLGAVEEEIGSFTTIDLNLGYKIPERILPGLDLRLSIQNLFDRDPPFMEPMFDFLVNYDSANYSAVGRFVRFSVSKTW